MKVLGLGAEGDSGAAVVEDGRLLAAENEERSSRLKLVTGFPRRSIRQVLALSGTEPGELDAVLVGGRDDRFVDQLEPFHDWFTSYNNERSLLGLMKRHAGRASRFGRRLPLLESAYYLAQEPAFRHRRRAISWILRDEFGIQCPIRFVDHHFSHITSAYFTSGFNDALVISLDGGGDRRSARVFAVRNGRWEELHEISAYNSLGNYYAYVTHLCGFKPMKHEGKITGLAAYGEPRYVRVLREFVDEVDGTIVNLGGTVFLQAVHDLEQRLLPGWTREDLAASVQRHFEEVVRGFVSHWVERTGLSDVALAGGVFANVRINQEVHTIPGVRRVFVYPAMSDAGLPAGAALAACVPGTLDHTMPYEPAPLTDVYLGSDLDELEVERALLEFELRPEPLDEPVEERVAELLAQGYVVARADGRMEYGPRALGNRSVLYQPTDRSVNDWLNKNLRRTEFMPFAPATLYEARNRCFEGVDGAEHAAEFMTITFDCTPWTRRHMEGIVHLDGTARPQLVRSDRSPGFYRIIKAFERRTGLPAIINTSFNMHEEPIVRSPRDCVLGFLEGKLDYLVLGPYLIKHPQGLTHPLCAVEAATGRRREAAMS